MSKTGERAEDGAPHSTLMFERFLDTSKRGGDDPEMLEAERFWKRLAHFSVPVEFNVQDRQPAWRTLGAVAASVCALLIGMTVWQHRTVTPQPWRSFAAPHGRQAFVMLEDGSSIALAAESRLAVRLSKDKRQLRLVAGQALFNVAHDGRRPFIVQAGKGSVTAVGTAFNIRLNKLKTEVTVVTGIVDVGVFRPGSLEDAQTVARVKRAEQVSFSHRYQDGSPVVYVSRRADMDVDRITSWTRGKLFFDGEPLSSAIDAVNAYSTRKVVLTNPALASMPVYGVVNQGDVRGLLILVNDKSAITTKGE